MKLKQTARHGNYTRWESTSGPRVVVEKETRMFRRVGERQRYHRATYSAWANGVYLGQFNNRATALVAIQLEMEKLCSTENS